jgi:hypothetical protein
MIVRMVVIMVIMTVDVVMGAAGMIVRHGPMSHRARFGSIAAQADQPFRAPGGGGEAG